MVLLPLVAVAMAANSILVLGVAGIVADQAEAKVGGGRATDAGGDVAPSGL